MAAPSTHAGWRLAWVDALEVGLLGSVVHLAKGRALVRQDRLSRIEVEPGLVTARVEVAGADERFVPQISVQPLGDDEWGRLVDVVVSRSVLAVAVLTGELPFEIHNILDDSGVSLVPSAAQTSIDCTCPSWTDACAHVTGLGFVVADLIEADPWTLLVLRGRDRGALIDAVRSRRAELAGDEVIERTHEPREADAGVVASAAYRREPTRLPPSALIPQRPGTPISWSAAPPADSGIDAQQLRDAVADAAWRAVELLSGTGTSGLELSVDADLARRAHHSDDVSALAAAAQVDVDELARAALGWGCGGAAGFDILTLVWDPPAEMMESAAALFSGRVRVKNNVVTSGPVQLRVDRSHTWWRFVADDHLGWMIDSGGFDDPDDAVPL
jgi:uncharacterized Zn finger protein